jgi:hypothetical protein
MGSFRVKERFKACADDSSFDFVTFGYDDSDISAGCGGVCGLMSCFQKCLTSLVERMRPCSTASHTTQARRHAYAPASRSPN